MRPTCRCARGVFEAFNIPRDRVSRARPARDPPDVAIIPALSDVGLCELHRAEEGIALGRAARTALPRIRAAARA